MRRPIGFYVPMDGEDARALHEPEFLSAPTECGATCRTRRVLQLHGPVKRWRCIRCARDRTADVPPPAPPPL